MTQVRTEVRLRLARKREDARKVAVRTAKDIATNHGTGRLFLALFLQEFLKRVAAAYLDKSRGTPDDLGNTWKELAPSTIARKARRISLPAGYVSSRYASMFARRSGTTFNELLAAGMDAEKARRKANALAWRALGSTKAAIQVPIGIETGRLYAAVQPGTVTRAGYVPPNADQKVTVSSGQIRLKIDVPYAKHFHKVRPIFPSSRSMSPWIRDAVTVAASKIDLPLETRS